jgi:predicted MFS family arabinose efflux permease
VSPVSQLACTVGDASGLGRFLGMTSPPDRRVIIPALGITQIFAWGSTFYLPAALASLIASDTNWSYDLIVAGVSVGLLVAGLASPHVGRVISEKGGRSVLACGALLLALGLVGIATAPNIAWFVCSWLVIGVGMSASLYDAAFSTLGRIYGGAARNSITTVTLFGGLASTICWPLSAFLAARLGWRGACLSYAAVQIVISLPIHLLALPSVAASETIDVLGVRPPLLLQRDEKLPFWLLAAVLTLGASVLSIVGTQLLPLLTARGIEMSVAVALGAIVGPSQVAARLIEFLIGDRYDPIWTLVASATLVAISALMLTFGFPLVALAIAIYGVGNGVGSVARGTVPLSLFGADRYPVLMGRLAFALMIAMAVSPYLAGLAFQHGGADWTLRLLTAVTVANVVLVGALRWVTRR